MIFITEILGGVAEKKFTTIIDWVTCIYFLWSVDATLNFYFNSQHGRFPLDPRGVHVQNHRIPENGSEVGHGERGWIYTTFTAT